jgi:hypothetical protein
MIVTGYMRDGRPYAADVVANRRHPLYGAVDGPPFLLALLHRQSGREIAIAPTGPFVTLDLNDPAAALAALYALTQVIEVRAVDGETVPPPLADPEPGVLY